MYIIEKKQICYNGGKYSKKHTKIKESHMEKRTLYREGTYKKGNHPHNLVRRDAYAQRDGGALPQPGL